MKYEVVLQKSSRSVRQMPQNYCIAHQNIGQEWICNPDAAADPELCLIVFKAIRRTHEAKWGDGTSLMFEIAELKRLEALERNARISWNETMYEMSVRCENMGSDLVDNLADLRTIAQMLTDEFEKKYQDTEWDVDAIWYDELDSFFEENHAKYSKK